ncbi:cell wall integrity and stress response component [Entomortierella parvispora]|uniref:Cell wall integrity and stress response component n=1 Tax=Entomortierella parvispora TaxID=205924 RepID=A0A9P3HLN1_9FUNG|nr:cell wall integrity and stress response component [Entomortierella parvispora]
MRQLLIPLFTATLAWTSHLAHAQIAVGCFANQPDSSVGTDAKSYQDIYMSQGACTNFCKSSGTSYALTLDGSTCRCSNQAPLGSNKVDDSKCDKPCMGYPFEMCGGTSSAGLANVLLIGSSTSIPSATTGSGGSSNGNNNVSSSSNGGSQVVNGGKALNANNPDDGNSSSGGTSAGAVAAGVLAIIGFGVLFAVAVVFSKRRRQRLAQAVWTENMLLPSSLIHTSNDDELEGHDYTRSSPLYRNTSIHHHHHQAIPLPPSNAHFPPPPVLHPRQSGAMHMQQPSFPPMMISRYNSIRAGGATFQPFPHPSVPQGDASHLNYKEPLSLSTSSAAAAFGRGPQAIQTPLAALNEEELSELQDEMSERPLSRPSIRSMGSMGSVRHQQQQQQQQQHYHDRRGSVQRGSIDSSTTSRYYE